MTAAGRLLLSGMLWLSVIAPATAQTPVSSVSGRIVGPDNAAVASQTVVLHRVRDATGATVAETLTTEDGSFTLEYPLSADTASLYFVATRYSGELYIGPPFRADDQLSAGLIIQVGVPGTSASDMLGGGTAVPRPVGSPATSRNWLLLVIPLIGVAAVAVYALIPRKRIPADRALLIRIAEMDEQMSTAPSPRREALLEERAQLISRLQVQ